MRNDNPLPLHSQCQRGLFALSLTAESARFSVAWPGGGLADADPLQLDFLQIALDMALDGRRKVGEGRAEGEERGSDVGRGSDDGLGEASNDVWGTAAAGQSLPTPAAPSPRASATAAAATAAVVAWLVDRETIIASSKVEDRELRLCLSRPCFAAGEAASTATRWWMAARKSSPLRASVGSAADFAALTLSAALAAATSCKAFAAYEGTTPRWSSCARPLVAAAHRDAAASHASADRIEADAGGEVSGGGRGRSGCGGDGGDCSSPRDVLRSTSA